MRKVGTLIAAAALAALTPGAAMAQGGTPGGGGTPGSGVGNGNAVDLSLGNLPPSERERGFPWGLLGLLGLAGLIPRLRNRNDGNRRT